MSTRLEAVDRLIVALDVASLDQAKHLVNVLQPLGERGPVFKIGYHTLFSGGLTLAQDLARQGLKVFLDAKLHDIPATVEGGVRALAAQGFWCVSVHALAQTIAGAARGAEGTELKILGVTVLTSIRDGDLTADGLPQGTDAQVLLRARQALSAGAQGLVASPLEVAALRTHFGAGPLLITPGVRPKGSDPGDQARIMRPAEALRAGADALVIGRPIVRAPDPLEAARQILDEMATAL